MTTICFSVICLTLSLVAAPVFAQLIEIQDPQPNSAQLQSEEGADDAASDPLVVLPPKAKSQTLVTQPVTISAGMAPALVPQVQVREAGQPSSQPLAQISSSLRSNDPLGLGIQGASTGVGGANPGNANTGGVQVQTVHVTAAQEQNATTGYSKYAQLRREMEEENNRKVVDRVEMDRIENENDRSKVISDFSLTPRKGGAANNQLETTPVVPMQSAPIIIAQASPTPVAVESVSYRPERDERNSAFKLSPYAGYSWTENNNAEYYSRNMGVFGVALEGHVNSFLSIEGSFAYSYDQFDYQGANFVPAHMGPNNYAPSNYYNNGYSPYSHGPNYYPNALEAARSRDNFEVQAVAKAGPRLGTVRPYVLGGIGGMFRNYDIDDSYTKEMLNEAGLSRTTQHVTGNWGGGLDVELNTNSAIGARFDYVSVINKESSNMHDIYGDQKNRYRLVGSFQLIF